MLCGDLIASIELLRIFPVRYIFLLLAGVAEFGRPACRQAGASGYMFYVYAIKSKERNYIYVGLTSNPARRIGEHNGRRERITRAYAPFIIILLEEYKTRVEARKREKYLKSGVGKEYLKSL